MFQSDDEITFDADFLSDTFDLASTTTSTECAKRHLEENSAQPVKKICTLSQPKQTLDILSLLSSRAENRVPKSPEHRFTRPVLPNRKRRVVQRKFPGPAGILPAQKDVRIDLKKLENSDSPQNDERSDSDEMLLVCSQQSDDVFSRPAWQRMLQDLGSVPGESAPGVVLPERYTIAWAKARAARRQLNGGRTPFLAAVVQQIDCSTRNPMAVLKDQTGEIQATLIHEVWEEYSEQLHTGAVILLRQVGVLSTAKQHYLAITLNNLFAIYSDETSGTSAASGSAAEPAATKVNYMTSSDFIKTLADIRHAEKSREIAANNPIFPASDNYSWRNNRVGLDSNAECSRKNNATRSDTRNVNSLELFPTAEFSYKQARSETRPRSDTLSRSDTPGGPINALGLVATAERTSTQRNMAAECTTSSHAHSIISETPTFLRPDFDKTTDKSSKSSQESEMLSQILDGLDAESIFDDF